MLQLIREELKICLSEQSSETKTYVGTNSPTHKERKTTVSILLLHGYLTTSNSNQLKITNNVNQSHERRPQPFTY